MVSNPPFKAPKLAIARRARVRTLARASIRSAVTQIRRNSRGARIGHDPDYAHQLRVGTRRLRVCLRLFKTLLDPAHTRAIEDDLRWIFQKLGAMREYDVLLADVLKPLQSEAPSESLTQLGALLREEREVLALASRRALSTRRYVHLLRTLRALPNEIAPHRGQKRARKWAAKRLDKRLDAVLALRSAALGPDEVARHELRKEMKKLRYAAELMRGLWPTERVKAYLEPLADVQDVLGVLNDVAVGRSLLLHHVEHVDPAMRDAVDACLTALARRGEQQLPELEKTFPVFEHAPPYWR